MWIKNRKQNQLVDKDSWTMNYCRIGTGDLYVVWWPPSKPEPPSGKIKLDDQIYKSFAIPFGHGTFTLGTPTIELTPTGGKKLNVL